MARRCCASSAANSAAGNGQLKEYPCISSQRRSRKAFSCCSVFHALGDDLQSQRSRQRENGRHQRHRVRVVRHSRDERAVDLQHLNGQLGEIAQRRIAGGEVVHRQAYAEPADCGEPVHDVMAILHDLAFGDLELEELRSEPGLRKRSDNHFHEALRPQLPRRQID
jgi:hypothetical protein